VDAGGVGSVRRRGWLLLLLLTPGLRGMPRRRPHEVADRTTTPKTGTGRWFGRCCCVLSVFCAASCFFVVQFFFLCLPCLIRRVDWWWVSFDSLMG
jgi:hypothetical protein